MADTYPIEARSTGAGGLGFYSKVTGLVVFAFSGDYHGLPLVGSQNAMTALAGGGQTGATQITTSVARFTTVASGNDSAMLPPSVSGMQITVVNAAASNSMNVYAQTGEVINALSANSPFAVAANKVCTFTCAVSGTWNSNLTA